MFGDDDSVKFLWMSDSFMLSTDILHINDLLWYMFEIQRDMLLAALPIRGAIYNQLLLLKKQEVYAEIQSAMGEIHQAARFDQKNVIEKADDVLSAKKKSAAETPTLTQLDAMKIQIGNIRQQYIKALMIPMNPQEKIATAYRSSLGYSIKLKNEADIDKYVADIKEKLLEMLKGNDALHII